LRRAHPAPLRVECQFAAHRPWVPPAAALRRWASQAHAAVPARRRFRAGAMPEFSVCIRVVGLAASRRLNREYRGRDKATNVLSFPAAPAERSLTGALGDLVVCAAIVAAEARAQGKDPRAHWAHMVVHGLLHLHGFDHHEPRPARRMERLEVEILRGFGYQNPYRQVTPRKQ
jgi:probable rRNA maturation factor